MHARQDNWDGLWAGAATADLTPTRPMFLFGYPHVPRMSTGVHDRLQCAALYLGAQQGKALILANDLIFVGRALATEVRRRLQAETGVPAEAIVLTATHTHSGPVTVDYMSNSADPVVPPADPAYLAWVADRMVAAGCAAVQAAEPAELGATQARAEGVGTNRHDPSGPADSAVSVLLVRSRAGRPLACMLAYAMHPTVLHEDSTLISGDFPHFTREYLRTAGALPADCVILYHNGASGNQSPRHVTQANTFAEAQRLGERLGAAVAAVLPAVAFSATGPIAVHRMLVPLPLRPLPTVAIARERAQAARQRFTSLATAGGARAAVRSAECDWFGAEETVALAAAAEDGRVARVAAACSPAEVQVFALGAARWAFWPGEFFAEYALAVKLRYPATCIVTMANGELQGYVVTPEAVAQGTYEATNALFAPESGRRVVTATLALLTELQDDSTVP